MNNFTMGKPNSPCKICNDRYIGCHSKCDKYNKYKNNLEKINKQQKEDIFNNSVCAESCLRIITKKIKRNKDFYKTFILSIDFE